jgi:hypothetical protein
LKSPIVAQDKQLAVLKLISYSAGKEANKSLPLLYTM